MKIPISDLMEDCFFEDIDIQEEITVSPEMKNKIMNQIKTDPQFRKRTRPIRLLAVASVAVIASCTAFAAGLYAFHRQNVEPDVVVEGVSISEAEDGTLEKGTIAFQGPGMKFSFLSTGKVHEIWVRPEYLPEGTVITPDTALNVEGESGWYQHLTSESLKDPDEPIPWKIDVHYAEEDSEFFMPGNVKVLKEDTWDKLQVTELSVSGNAGQPFGNLKYNCILVFDPENGYLIDIDGTLDIGELEQIAKNLQVKVTDQPAFYPDQNRGLSLLGLGRG